jgi:hypothetical protein
MAISEAFNGSASIGTTEYDLPSASTTISAQTTDGIYQLFLDLNALASGDEYRLRIYEKVQSSSTQRVVQEVIFSGAQTTEPVYVTPAILFLHGWTFTLKKNFGTDRTINWSIRSVA